MRKSKDIEIKNKCLKQPQTFCRFASGSVPAGAIFTGFTLVDSGANTGFNCWVTRMNVVLLDNSRSSAAPTYVHVERTPPKMSRMVSSIGPRYGTVTVFPSDDRYSATPPACMPPSMTKSAPPPKALATSPAQVHPPSDTMRPPNPCAASEHSKTADNCG